MNTLTVELDLTLTAKKLIAQLGGLEYETLTERNLAEQRVAAAPVALPHAALPHRA